jgi:hypothetical protein
MQQVQREMDLRRELRYRQAEGRATDRNSPKRAREKERGEPQLQEENPTQSMGGGTGNPGVPAELYREGQGLNDEGYETLTFTNNTGTRYSHWLHTPHANRNRAYDSASLVDSSVCQII